MQGPSHPDPPTPLGDLAAQNKGLSSIRSELVPFLVDRQFQTAEYLRDAVPALPTRAGTGARPLAAVDQWLHSGAGLKAWGVDADAAAASGESKAATVLEGASPRLELVDYIFQEIAGGAASAAPTEQSSVVSSSASFTTLSPHPSSASVSSAAATALAGQYALGGGRASAGGRGAAAGSSSSGRAGPAADDASEPDYLRCFALVYERRGNMGAHGVQRHYRELDALHLLQVRAGLPGRTRDTACPGAPTNSCPLSSRLLSSPPISCRGSPTCSRICH